MTEPDEPDTLPEDDSFRARRAFIKFQRTLEWFESEMKPLEPQMSIECHFELECMGKLARSFFRMANMEIFGKAGIEEKVGK